MDRERSRYPSDEGVVPKQRAFEDGGLADDEEDEFSDVTGAVTDMGDSGGGEAAGGEQPTVVDAQKADKLLDPGAYDKVVDKGWLGYLKDILGMGDGYRPDPKASGPAERLMSNGRNMETGAGAQPVEGSVLSRALQSGIERERAEPPIQGPAISGLADRFMKFKQGDNPNLQTPQQPAAPKAAPPMSGSAGAQMPEPKPAGATAEERLADVPRSNIVPETPPNAAPEGAALDKEEKMLERRLEMLQRIAIKRYGSDAERKQFVEQQMSNFAQGNLADRRAGWDARERMAQTRADAENEKQMQLNIRNQNTTAARMGIERMKQQYGMMRDGQKAMINNAAKILIGTPGITPDEVNEQLRPLARQAGIPLNVLRDYAHVMAKPDMYGGGMGGGQQQQGGAPQGGQEPQANQAPQRVVKGADGVERRFRLQPNGKYIEVK